MAQSPHISLGLIILSLVSAVCQNDTDNGPLAIPNHVDQPNNLKFIPETQPILVVATPSELDKHVDQLLGGLLIPKPMPVTMKVEPQTVAMTTPAIFGVLSGLLIPKPSPPVTSIPTASDLIHIPDLNASDSGNVTSTAQYDQGAVDMNQTTFIGTSDFKKSISKPENIFRKSQNESHRNAINPSTAIFESKWNNRNTGLGFESHRTRIFENKLYEFVYPVIIGICLLTTLFLMFILFEKLRRSTQKMSKSSCALLIAIATADILTMCFALAEIAYMFNLSRDENGYLLFENCKTLLILERLSAVPHAASTWFTVILAFQRFLCVWRPFSAGNYITVKSSLVCILVVSFFSLAMHICRFFDNTFEKINAFDVEKNITTIVCQRKYATWVEQPTLYESVFAWTRICLAQLIPSILIVIFIALMIIYMRKMTLASMHLQTTDSKMYSERRRLSFFVAVVAIIVFTVEMSSGIFLSFNAWEITTGQTVFSYELLKSAAIAFDLILYVSYFVIFLIYCLMSEEIRKKIIAACHRLKPRNKVSVTSSTEQPSSNSSKQSTLQIFSVLNSSQLGNATLTESEQAEKP